MHKLPLLGVVRVGYPKMGYTTSNPLCNYHFGTENDPPMNFSILTHRRPCTRVPPLGGGGGGAHGPQRANILCKTCVRPCLCVFHPIWVGEGSWMPS